MRLLLIALALLVCAGCTYNHVYFEKGDIESAIKYQTMAVAHAENDRMGEGIREALKKYEAARGG